MEEEEAMMKKFRMTKIKKKSSVIKDKSGKWDFKKEDEDSETLVAI